MTLGVCMNNPSIISFIIPYKNQKRRAELTRPCLLHINLYSIFEDYANFLTHFYIHLLDTNLPEFLIKVCDEVVLLFELMGKAILKNCSHIRKIAKPTLSKNKVKYSSLLSTQEIHPFSPNMDNCNDLPHLTQLIQINHLCIRSLHLLWYMVFDVQDSTGVIQ